MMFSAILTQCDIMYAPVLELAGRGILGYSEQNHLRTEAFNILA